MNETAARSTGLLLLVSTLLVGAGCGKRANPLPPLQRVPAAPTDVAVTRIDTDLYVRFTVPPTNIDGLRPADVARVDVYAITLDRELSTLFEVDQRDLRAISMLVGSEQVRRPLPPATVDNPLPSPPAGVDQGAVVVVREAISPAIQTPAKVPDTTARANRPIVEQDPPRPLTAPDVPAGPLRYYYAVAVSDRGRYGPHSAMVPAPLASTSGAPSGVEIAVSETSVTLKWTPPSDARGASPVTAGPADPADPPLLPSRSLVPVPPSTTYDVYEISRNASPDLPLDVPAPLTSTPVTTPEYTHAHSTFGVERCFAVRSVDIVDGIAVRGPASDVQCKVFADTFAPSGARELVAVAIPGAINLFWEPSTAKDVAGYIVLRGEAGSATLTPLMTTPVSGLSYRDESVKAGVRYVYAVLAVDTADNRSEESNRVEETAR